MRRLEGKTALVTGAGRGIGEGVARRLASEGAAVCVVDIDGARAEEVAASLGGDSFALAADLSVRAEAETVVPAAWERFGSLDVLVNNAGITRDSMLHKMTDEQWDSVIALDLTAVFVLTRAAATRMRERGSGRIVNISSISADGNVGQANYAAAKAGVIGITKTAAKELAGKGVTVNVIAPGFIDTEMTRSMPPEVYEAVRSRVPVGRAGTPDDVAAMIAYLASDEASYITGELLYVRGGI